MPFLRLPQTIIAYDDNYWTHGNEHRGILCESGRESNITCSLHNIYLKCRFQNLNV